MANEFDWTTIDWDDLYPRLMLIAAGKLRRLTWRGERFGSGAIPGGKTAKDIVHDAIVKTMSGDRLWDRANPLLEHLAGVISSEISNLVTAAENRRTHRADDKLVLMIPDQCEDPETIVLRKKQEQEFLIYLEKKKPILRLLAELILYDPVGGTPELMVKLSLSFREVESLKKALRRATEDYGNGGSELRPGSGATNVVSLNREQLSNPAEKGATNGS
jgi:hypothetical protein